jgi:hypothetical protein
MKLPTIDGKEIVPVRLIPLITNAWLGHVTLAGILANILKVSGWPNASDYEQIEVNIYDEETDSTELTKIRRSELLGCQQRDNGVHAYHLSDDGEPVKMWPSEWEVIYREISVLEPVLRKTEEKNGVPDSMESAWRLKASKILPPGVFLWREELDLLWNEHISSFSTTTEYDPPDFRKMNYDVYIRPEYRKLIWEGFEHLMLIGNTSQLPPTVSADAPVVKLVQKAEEQEEDSLEKYVSNWKNKLPDSQIAFEIKNRFGWGTKHRKTVLELAQALGWNPPTGKGEHRRKEIDALKTKFNRLCKKHKK